MNSVFWIADNLITPLGSGSSNNFEAVKKGESAIKLHENLAIEDRPFYASIFSDEQRAALNNSLQEENTFFERLCVACINGAIAKTKLNFNENNTVLILSTTKGNIELIENPDDERIRLGKTAERIVNQLGIKAKTVVVSNACISGVSAIITAKRLLEAGKFEHAIVCGADLITKFVATGFQALRATADSICRPYDESRNGINLGEAAGAIILSVKQQTEIELKEGYVTNDSNHISGPSKTGEELGMAVKMAIDNSGIAPSDLAFVSAHGTATAYNDEMESKAFEISGLSHVPINSLKPHFGHTLGAAGVIESIISKYAFWENTVLPSKNYQKKGVSGNINIASKHLLSHSRFFLKTASGFGGCNAAIVFSKTDINAKD